MFKIGYALNSHKSTLVSLRLMTDPHVVADHQIDDDVYTCEDRELICYNKNEKYDPDWNSGCDFLSQGSWPLEFPAAPNANVEKECSVAFQNAPLPRYNAPSDKGCWIFAADYDLWLDPGSASDDNECAFAQAREGIVIDGSKFSSFELYGIRSFSSSDNYEYWKIGGKYKYNDEKPNSYCLIKSYKWKWDKQESYMCADDHYWHACRGDEEDLNDLGSLTWASDYIYNCTRDKDTNLPVWKLMGEDKDQDGYTTENDCADDPKDPILQQTDCPELDIETGEINCEPYQQYSKCAICINPDAPEVCGDELNNDCRFGSGFSADSLENTKDETSDDCNKFKEGCEQGFKETKEEKGEGNCNPPSEPKEGEEEKDYSIYDNKQSACENAGGTWKPAEGKQHFNVLGEEFSWVNTPEGGYCCGINGTDDLGHIESNLDGENFVCLNKAEELVGTSENIEDLNWGTEQTPCSNWCWVKASAGNVLFKILTIKKPGEPAFDVVSNSDKWFSCDENIETLEEPNTQGEGEENFIELANRFYCYQEGKHWSWTECYGKNEFTKNENIKGRLAGEGLYSLYLVAKDENANGEVFDRRIELNTGKGDYEKFYGEADFDFSSYDYLEFMLKFVADEQGTSIEKLDDLVLPLNVSLEIRGRPEKVDEKGPLLFQGNALGYVINNPSFTGEDWMHIRIPIDNTLQGIQKIVIETKSDKNYIGVKNIRLTKSSGDDSKLCSGQDSTVDNSWLDDLDQGGKTITGENLCKALYGEEAWFGDDGEIDSSQDSANCCGNNENEYYAGKSKDVVIIEEDSSSEPKKYGCWNSQTVASGNTIMDVKFNVDIYKEKNFTVTPNPIELDNIIDVTYEVNDKSKDIPCNFPTELQYGEDFKQLCSPFKIKDLSNAVYGNTSVRIDYKPSDKYRLVFYDLITFEEIGYHFDEDEDPDHPEPYHIIDNETAQELWYHPIAVFVEIKEGVYFDITSKPSSNEMPEKQVTYSCTEDECLYPLPGEPPYTITNPFPHVYELYFVTGPQKEDEVLIEGTYNTNEYGNLKAR
ncbi:MAG: hypothetical protein KKD75_02440, partial [Nanoarchaeota archaeon]|nr:hypothetical protein [Nanoarchaeota archaeon]MBU1632671.1 hypothetical protein [Nanoarchaeota archaeon]MBU1875902.1 hypothetical protein [Nanoarchaeota archaeon]